MKARIITIVLLLAIARVQGQQLIQASIRPGVASNEIEIWLKPNFTNSTQYLAQMVLPIAVPNSAPHAPTSVTATIDPGFTAVFGNNYQVSYNPVAHNTANTETYFGIVLMRSGSGASDPQTWTSGLEFKLLTATFSPANSPGSKVKIADYQDGGSDGQGNFYTADGNANYYVTSNSIGNFYAIPGQSATGGNASAGFAETISLISLPVNILRFNGFRNGDKNTLQWITSDETNNTGFEIQRSADGNSYSAIGFVPSLATNGNSIGKLSYSFVDNLPTGKKQFYRLKQIDFNGHNKMSSIVVIEDEMPIRLKIVSLFPNPSPRFLNILLASPGETQVELNIFDFSGHLVRRQTESVGAGTNSIGIDISQLSGGNYSIQVKEKDKPEIISAQFIKQ